MKLQSLLSKDNNSRACLYAENIDATYTITERNDVNLDKFYHNNECFGNDYNFYILTSSFSFSCGNAFPMNLKNSGTAKIIGHRSGGGECTVESLILPNGMNMVHSSLTHIGWYNEEEMTFKGYEEGVTVDIQVPYEDYFDIEKLVEYIK